MHRLSVVAVAALGLGALALPAYASSIEHERLEAHIPFAFHLPQATLPAGDYEIIQASDVDPNLLEIRSADSRHAAFFLAEGAVARSAVRRPSLVFDRLGADRFLRAIWIADGEGDFVPATPAEVADARQVAVSHRHAVRGAARRP